MRSTIVSLVREKGPSLAGDPRRVEAFLRDLCGEHPAEIAVAVAALRSGVLVELQASGSAPSQPASLLMPRLVSRLHEDLGIDESLSRWAVGTWALALGAADAATVATMDSGSEAEAEAEAPEQTATSATWPTGEETASVAVQGAEAAGATAGDVQAHAAGSAPPARGAWPAWLGTRRRRVAVAGVLLLLLAAVGANLSGLGRGSSSRRPAPSTTGRSGSSAPSPLGSSPTSSRAGFGLPPFGTYRYATTLTGGSASTTSGAASGQTVSTAEVLHVGNQVGVAWTGFGDPMVESDLYSFSPQSIVETSSEFLNASGAPVTTACTWSPPLVTYKEPLEPGRSWSFSSSCTFSASGTPASAKLLEVARVVKLEQVSVPLGTFRAVLVDLTDTTTTALSGRTPSVDHMTMAIALNPSTGIPVSEAYYDETTGQTMTAKLEGFTPLASSPSGSG